MVRDWQKEKQAEYKYEHYHRNKEYYKAKRIAKASAIIKLFTEYKNTLQCVLCQESESIVLGFHHLDDPYVQVEKMVFRATWPSIVKEIERCVCLCANCQTKVNNITEWSNKIKLIEPLVVPPEFRENNYKPMKKKDYDTK